MLVLRELSHSSPWIGAEEALAVATTLASGKLAQGEGARAFELELTTALSARIVRVTSSGTEALVLALAALNVGLGDEVVCPTYVCASVATAIRRVGGVPVFADNGSHWTLSAESVRAACTSRTRAIVAVHLFGLACDIDAIAAYGIPVIEDACQAFGLVRANSRAAFVVYSFHATKCLTAGEGGAIAANSVTMAQALDAAIVRGVAGMRFSDVQASIARVQLSRYNELLSRRAEIAATYLSAFPEPLTRPWRDAAARGAVWFRALLWLPASASPLRLRTLFADAGVAVRHGVDALLHRTNGLSDGAFPKATLAFERTLSVPLWPAMHDDDVDHVIDAVRAHVGC